MNFKHIMIVFKKEVKDIIRDKKTIITSMLVPMIIMPVLLMIVGGGAEKLTKDINENITIALSQKSNTQEIRELVKDKLIADNKNIKLAEVDNPVDAIRQEKVRAVLELDKDCFEKLKANKPFNIKVMYDDSKTKSQGSLEVIKDVIAGFNAKIIKQRVTDAGLDPEILSPSNIVEKNVADKKQSGNAMLMMILPMLLGMLITVGGIPAATDLVAGEKERNTFEPLLTTKPSRLSLLLGKYFTVTLFSFVSAISTIAGLIIGFIANPNSMSAGMGTQGGGGFYMEPGALILAIAVTMLLGMTFSGIQIALSTYAKSFKEAQTYLSFLIFVVMIPSYATMFTQPSEIQWFMYVVPVLNTISAFKMVLGGIINYPYLVMALASSVVYVVASVLLAAWMFTKEKALFRS